MIEAAARREVYEKLPVDFYSGCCCCYYTAAAAAAFASALAVDMLRMDMIGVQGMVNAEQ